MLTEAAARWDFLASLFLLDLDSSEVWADNWSNADSLLGGGVVGIGLKQQLVECTVTSWHPAYPHWDGEI